MKTPVSSNVKVDWSEVERSRIRETLISELNAPKKFISATAAILYRMDIAMLDKYSTYRAKHGRHEISCKLGLWSVDCPDQETAINEALHYFNQYYEDGEYKDFQA